MKSNKQKFDHYFEVGLNVFYIATHLALWCFTVITIIEQY